MTNDYKHSGINMSHKLKGILSVAWLSVVSEQYFRPLDHTA